jgi:hypothetical protein
LRRDENDIPPDFEKEEKGTKGYRFFIDTPLHISTTPQDLDQ